MLKVHDPISLKQWFVILITVATVGLWCVGSVVERYFGNMGVVAALPIFAFCGFGIIKKEQLMMMDWPIIMLAQVGENGGGQDCPFSGAYVNWSPHVLS